MRLASRFGAENQIRRDSPLTRDELTHYRTTTGLCGHSKWWPNVAAPCQCATGSLASRVTGQLTRQSFDIR